MIAARSDRPLSPGNFDVDGFRAIHRHLFGRVYAWAGEFRTVRISKGDSTFCYPEHIGSEIEHIFAWLAARDFLTEQSTDDFAADAAHLLATLNAIHPFREGNGRTQLSFMSLLADRAGHPLAFDRLRPEAFLAAMIRSFAGDEEPLAQHLRALIGE